MFPIWLDLQKHPEVEAIRVKGCPHYEQLDRIFSESGSSGNYAFPESQTAASKVLVLFISFLIVDAMKLFTRSFNLHGFCFLEYIVDG